MILYVSLEVPYSEIVLYFTWDFQGFLKYLLSITVVVVPLTLAMQKMIVDAVAVTSLFKSQGDCRPVTNSIANEA